MRRVLAIVGRIATVGRAIDAVVAQRIVRRVLTVIGCIAGVDRTVYTVVAIGVVCREFATVGRIADIVGAIHAVAALRIVGRGLTTLGQVANIVGAIHAVVALRIIRCVLAILHGIAGIRSTIDAVVAIGVVGRVGAAGRRAAHVIGAIHAVVATVVIGRADAHPAVARVFGAIDAVVAGVAVVRAPVGGRLRGIAPVAHVGRMNRSLQIGRAADDAFGRAAVKNKHLAAQAQSMAADHHIVITVVVDVAAATQHVSQQAIVLVGFIMPDRFVHQAGRRAEVQKRRAFIIFSVFIPGSADKHIVVAVVVDVARAGHRLTEPRRILFADYRPVRRGRQTRRRSVKHVRFTVARADVRKFLSDHQVVITVTVDIGDAQAVAEIQTGSVRR